MVQFGIHRGDEEKKYKFLILIDRFLVFYRITVKARCNMNLKNFPVDTQICKFLVGSCKNLISD